MCFFSRAKVTKEPGSADQLTQLFLVVHLILIFLFTKFSSLGHMFERILVQTILSQHLFHQIFLFTSSLDKNPFPGGKKTWNNPVNVWTINRMTCPEFNPIDQYPYYLQLTSLKRCCNSSKSADSWATYGQDTQIHTNLKRREHLRCLLVQFFCWIFKKYLYMGGVCAIHNIGAMWD